MSQAWRAWVSEGAIESIDAAAGAAHPNETGGVLVGVLAEGRPWVVVAAELTPACRRPAFYESPRGGRQRAVRALRRRDRRLGYLGEWHSHPMDVGPSGQDATTMDLLARTGDCARPLLIVARRAQGEYDLDARQWTGRSLRPVRLILAGDLPEAPQDGRAGRRRAPRPLASGRERRR